MTLVEGDPRCRKEVNSPRSIQVGRPGSRVFIGYLQSPKDLSSGGGPWIPHPSTDDGTSPPEETGLLGCKEVTGFNCQD